MPRHRSKSALHAAAWSGTIVGDVTCSKYSNGSSTVIKVKTLHINSAILASSSPFFYKLFKNGMRESQEKNVTLRINASEEGAFMDLLSFIHSNTLSASSASDLLGVLIAADKFEISSCMSHCIKLLQEIPMSLESAMLYVEIPSSVLLCEAVQSSISDGKRFLRQQYGDITQLIVTRQEEAMRFPLSAIEVVLDGTYEVRSEEDVYEFIVKWGRARYPKLPERQQVLTKLVGQFLHFPYLCMSTLQEIQDSPDFDNNQVTSLILESLYMNSGFPYGKERHRFPSGVSNRIIKRGFYDLPIKEVKSESRHFVYLNLTEEVCKNLVELGGSYSQAFFLGDHRSFKLRFRVDAEGSIAGENYLGLYVERVEGSFGNCCVDYEFEVMKEEEVGFESVYKRMSCSLFEEKRVGSSNILGIPWSDVAEEQTYFIDGILHLRAQFTMNNPKLLGC